MEKKKIILFFFAVLSFSGLHSGTGNRFVWAQLKHSGAWDPYPTVHERVFSSISSMTNIPFAPDRSIVTLLDKDLFYHPFLFVKGNSSLSFTKEEKQNLKLYIDRGGFVFFDDTLGVSGSDFYASVVALFKDIYPDRTFEKLSAEHAVYRSFFLLKNAVGRHAASKTLDGLIVTSETKGEGRTAVLLCSNDLLGAWVKDNLGQYAYICQPGGEAQRWEAFKLTVNLIYFSITGTYKKDAIHQPFIEQKLGN